nr:MULTISPECIES: hypothetical protein [unclassified Corynebacterium]
MLRDILIRLAGTDIYQARWTEDILDEVFRNFQANRPDLDPSKLRRTIELMYFKCSFSAAYQMTSTSKTGALTLS